MIFGGIKPSPMIVFAVYTMSFCQQYNLGVSLDSGASYFQRKPLVYHLQIMFIAFKYSNELYDRDFGMHLLLKPSETLVKAWTRPMHFSKNIARDVRKPFRPKSFSHFSRAKIETMRVRGSLSGVSNPEIRWQCIPRMAPAIFPNEIWKIPTGLYDLYGIIYGL